MYGASSQAGTIRIITNQPDSGAFASGYALEGNYVDGDEFGYVAEGFVNIPMGDTAAIRIVGWAKHEPGWIDNVEATRIYPGNLADPDDDVTVNNAEFAEDNYNTVDTVGARAALRIDLGDNWTVTPSVMYQKSEQEGSWGDDVNDFIPEAAGKNKVAHFRDEFYNDEWYQAGLTIEGSISNFDVVYSGNYLNREDDGSTDYSDYSYFYDLIWSTGPYAGTFANLFVDNNGVHLNRAHSYTADDYYTKTSHEVRISTPVDKRVRGLLGVFYQKQYHDFHEEFGNVEGLADFMSMNFLEPDSQRFPGVVYLNSMDRTDYEEAVFGQIQFDITDTLELSLGGRFFDVENKVHGFFGFGLGFNPGRVPGSSDADIQPTEPGEPPGGSGTFLPGGAAWSRNGEWRCPSQEDRKDAPCVNADREVTESDSVYRVNLGWKATDTSLLYATWSEGFRPGGINRNPAVPDYVPDILTNYELGWKSRWADDRLQFNAAVFLEEWDNIQVAFQGLNGITQVENGPEAEIKGTEMQLDWLATDNLRLSLAGAYYDSELTSDYAPLGELKAPEGTPLPITAEFKGNVIARYMFPLGGFEAHVQGSLAYEGSRSSDLDIDDAAVFGGKSRRAPSSTSRSASKTTNTPSSCSWRMPRTRMCRYSSMPSVPLACAAARLTAWSRGRGRTASASSRTSDRDGPASAWEGGVARRPFSFQPPRRSNRGTRPCAGSCSRGSPRRPPDRAAARRTPRAAFSSVRSRAPSCPCVPRRPTARSCCCPRAANGRRRSRSSRACARSRGSACPGPTSRIASSAWPFSERSTPRAACASSRPGRRP